MRKLVVVLVSVLFLNSYVSRADEGMWLLSLIGKNYEQMQKAGFQLTPEDIYSVNKACIKDAIVGLGNEGSPFQHFCTGEIISNQGLLLTNHHCGFGMIQSHSTVSNDYLQDGFWAYEKSQELSNLGTTASILIRMEDVTKEVLSQLNDRMTEKERADKIKEVSEPIVNKAIEGTNYKAYVANMFSGNQFFLFVYVIYRDVRLVGAPPSSMGKFGGDTDNWMWPRHTADFSLFRIYTAPDGSPAAYAKENIPLKPKHFLPISIAGVKEGDFAMILGFPGTTDRFLTSYGLEETMNITNKLRYEIRTVKINVLREEMAASQSTKIKYASKYASCSNYWKYSEQQNKALKNLNMMEVKKQIERNYDFWANGNVEPRYKQALPFLEKGYEIQKPYKEARMYLTEALWSGTELPKFAYAYKSIIDSLYSKDAEKTERAVKRMKTFADKFYKNYNPETEKKLMIALFEYAYKNMDKTYYPDFFAMVEKKYKGDFTKFVNDLFAKSLFATPEKMEKFLQSPNPDVLAKDMAMMIGESIYKQLDEVNKLIAENADGLKKGERMFVNGVLHINHRKQMAPDANSTIRLTYGTVRQYEPRDGVTYHFYTTLKGVMEKENPASTEFFVPQKLKELYQNQDFGNYFNRKNEIVTCFITDNDITGGNSGSPVINAKGELIGTAFDGNSEAMSGDIDFEENLQRCINLDVRYMLFVVDRYANAQNLIEEMKIVK
jgi:hypothetical protein